ncbi:flagellar protein FliT [Neobacillus citreus]|uniref:Flagellar protein FliT n=1 Tax=Neobacillus citreus TaxID=2833578 RepID=A0A942SUI0_9BACI|nr:flagellar protein FliT [Neobacillus citreus]MCH6266829.1 flagellar protein FliT [Neobacillus citreus]
MNELIAEMLETTNNMIRAVKEKQFEDVVELLSFRETILKKVDEVKSAQSFFEYSPEEKMMIEETLLLDQRLTALLKEEMDTIDKILNQNKLNKRASQKYQLYSKQLNGAFVDTKK